MNSQIFKNSYRVIHILHTHACIQIQQHVLGKLRFACTFCKSQYCAVLVFKLQLSRSACMFFYRKSASGQIKFSVRTIWFQFGGKVLRILKSCQVYFTLLLINIRLNNKTTKKIISGNNNKHTNKKKSLLFEEKFRNNLYCFCFTLGI